MTSTHDNGEVTYTEQQMYQLHEKSSFDYGHDPVIWICFIMPGILFIIAYFIGKLTDN